MKFLTFLSVLNFALSHKHKAPNCNSKKGRSGSLCIDKEVGTKIKTNKDGSSTATKLKKT